MTGDGWTGFAEPVSTSNLVRPERAAVMRYARLAWEGAPVVRMLEQRLARLHHTEHCVALCNGFWGLVLAMHVLALPGRRDVLMPSLTYRRMADVAAWARLRPRFCEVEPASLACSAATMRAALTPEVGLLLGVHPIVGVCDAPAIEQLSGEYGLPLLFDSVESVFEWVDGRKIGGFGDAECFSLHASKLLNGLEGGYVTTARADVARRLSALRDGRPPDGLDLRLDRFHAAMALASLDDLDAQVERNRARYELYRRLLAGLPGVSLLAFEEAAPTSYKTVVVELDEDWPLSRDETVARLNASRVLARAYYHPPLHRKTMSYPHVAAELALTDRLAARYMLLPCGHHVDHAAIERVVRLLHSLVSR